MLRWAAQQLLCIHQLISTKKLPKISLRSFRNSVATVSNRKHLQAYLYTVNCRAQFISTSQFFNSKSLYLCSILNVSHYRLTLNHTTTSLMVCLLCGKIVILGVLSKESYDQLMKGWFSWCSFAHDDLHNDCLHSPLSCPFFLTRKKWNAALEKSSLFTSKCTAYRSKYPERILLCCYSWWPIFE